MVETSNSVSHIDQVIEMSIVIQTIFLKINFKISYYNIFNMVSRLSFVPTIVQWVVQLPGARASPAGRTDGPGARGVRARRRRRRARPRPARARPTTPGRETVYAHWHAYDAYAWWDSHMDFSYIHKNYLFRVIC